MAATHKRSLTALVVCTKLCIASVAQPNAFCFCCLWEKLKIKYDGSSKSFFDRYKCCLLAAGKLIHATSMHGKLSLKTEIYKNGKYRQCALVFCCFRF